MGRDKQIDHILRMYKITQIKTSHDFNEENLNFTTVLFFLEAVRKYYCNYDYFP